MQNFWNKSSVFSNKLYGKLSGFQKVLDKETIILLLIILLGTFLRLYNLNWDQNYHLHPDERAIVMFSMPLHIPSSFSEFLSKSSPLNPHFFAYGNLPLYLLKAVGTFAGYFYPKAVNYDQINIIGRFISVIFDMGTLILTFLLGRKLFSKTVGFLGMLFYAISVFPIQAAHFYAVDTSLTFFVLLTLYAIILFYTKPTKIRAIFIGILFGASLATKTSALALIVSIGTALIADFILIFIRNLHRPRVWFPHVPKFVKTLFTYGLIIIITTLIFFLAFEPYALLDFKEFWQQTLQQSQMTRDAFTFPYTLQYVDKIPYLYELKNIFFWGQGPMLATLSFLGVFYILFLIIKKNKEKKWAQELILVIFLLSYFAVVGKFAVGWMRYMLPLYPLLCLFGAVFVYRFLVPKVNPFPRILPFLIYNFSFLILLIWPLSFMHIYTRPNTRVLASEWINQNIPMGATIATEHWDDGLPIGTQGNYKVLELPMYESDTPVKWEKVNQTLQQTNYIIIASNRLYAPLMKLVNCEKLPAGRCYTQTAQYYKDLFSEKLGFKKITEFSIYPTLKLSIFNFQLSIDDSSADESFTVYDHPKVIIFKKLP